VIQNWFLGLGAEYGVNPLIFGAIYIGAIPFFSLSIGWLINNYRSRKSIVFPVLSAMLFFISAYIYLIFAGKNVPFWVYGAVVTRRRTHPRICFGNAAQFNSVRFEPNHPRLPDFQ
jgi:hypothetical protein